MYLFDGNNLLHAGGFDDRRALRDVLASFVALRGARGVLVFDGHGTDGSYGPLEVRHAPHADTLLERLAAEHRGAEELCLVSSDSVIRGTTGLNVRKVSSRTFLLELSPTQHEEGRPSQLRDRLPDDVRERLERLRRGEH